MAIIGQSATDMRTLLTSADNMAQLIDILGDKKSLKNRITELDGIDELIAQKNAILKAKADADKAKGDADKILADAQTLNIKNISDRTALEDMAKTLSSKVKIHEKDAGELAEKIKVHNVDSIKLANAQAAHAERVKRDSTMIAQAQLALEESKDLKMKLAAYKEHADGLKAIG